MFLLVFVADKDHPRTQERPLRPPGGLAQHAPAQGRPGAPPPGAPLPKPPSCYYYYYYYYYYYGAEWLGSTPWPDAHETMCYYYLLSRLEILPGRAHKPTIQMHMAREYSLARHTRNISNRSG